MKNTEGSVAQIKLVSFIQIGNTRHFFRQTYSGKFTKGKVFVLSVKHNLVKFAHTIDMVGVAMSNHCLQRFLSQLLGIEAYARYIYGEVNEYRFIFSDN